MENGAVKKEIDEVKVEKPAEDKLDIVKIESEKKEESKDEITETKDPEIKSDDIKSEVSVKSEECTEELLEKVKSQIEFYFGDINLQRDKFLIEQTKLDDGWVPMSVMLNFKLLASMTTDTDLIVKALKTSELIEVSDDFKKIRRNPENPLPVFDEAYRKAQAERTIYIKGFPLTGIYVQKLKDFFKDYEPIENIILRKYQDKEKKLHFKGSIFIQFKTLEGAKAFMAKESIKYNDTELIRKFSEDYSVEKAKEKEEKKEKKSKKGGENKEYKKDETDGAAEEEGEKIEFPNGAILHFKGVPSGTVREVIKDGIEKFGGDVAYVDFQRGDTEGWVRLQHENTAKAVIDKMDDNTMPINGETVTFRILEGEEEETYLKTVKETIVNLRNRTKVSKRGRSRRGRGGNQRGRKRHGSPARGGTPAKKAANTD